MLSKHLLIYLYSTLKVLDKRIETIDKQIGDMCLKKSVDASLPDEHKLNNYDYDLQHNYYNTGKIGEMAGTFNIMQNAQQKEEISEKEEVNEHHEDIEVDEVLYQY